MFRALWVSCVLPSWEDHWCGTAGPWARTEPVLGPQWAIGAGDLFCRIPGLTWSLSEALAWGRRVRTAKWKWTSEFSVQKVCALRSLASGCCSVDKVYRSDVSMCSVWLVDWPSALLCLRCALLKSTVQSFWVQAFLLTQLYPLTACTGTVIQESFSWISNYICKKIKILVSFVYFSGANLFSESTESVWSNHKSHESVIGLNHRRRAPEHPPAGT